MARTSTHYIETVTKANIVQIINSFYSNGDALIRELTEKDYGIDAILELFEDGTPTGMIAFLQLKGKEKAIEKLKIKDVVSCSISSSNAAYIAQMNIPVIVIYASMATPNNFFFYDLANDREKILSKMDGQDTITINIPIRNNVENLEEMIMKIKSYYKKQENNDGTV